MDTFLEPKHKRLYLIADIAGWFAWVVLAFGLLLTILGYSSARGWTGILQDTEASPLRSVEVARLAFNVAAPLMRAAVYFLLLRGVSVGLRMIVETDLNYRERRREGAE